jgi:superfamily II DNA/RNA helicase
MARRAAQEDDLSTFADLGADPQTVAALAAAGIHEPFAIQALAIPLAIAGNDLIGQARTGTGKTLAFGVPILARIDSPGAGRPQALAVVPTRELCVQVAGDLNMAGRNQGTRVLAIYGGRSYEPQVEALRSGVDVVVGTPGRLLDLARQRALDLSAIRILVLDEADEMLDLGFLPDVERILALTPASRQTMLFSATMPGPVVTLARRYMRQPTHLRAEAPDESATVPTTSQHVFRAHAMDKIELLTRVLQAEDRGLAMIFCRTKRTVARVADELAARGFAAAAVHGDLGQAQREQALRAFRGGKVDVLVATDVAARGIDVSGVTHVVNYQCPEDEKVYLHRIGRTGRAGGSGIAVTLVDWDDLARWQMINTALRLPFGEPPETYSTSEHLFEALDIPTGATGALPNARRIRAGLNAEAIEDLGSVGAPRATTRNTRNPHPDRPARSADGARRRAPARTATRSEARTEPRTDAPTAARTDTPTAARTDTPTATRTETERATSPRRRRRRRGGGGAGLGKPANGESAESA